MKHSKKLFEYILAAATLLLAVYTAVTCLRPSPPAEPVMEPLPVSAADAVRGDALLDLNTATGAELESLPGIGSVLAGRMIAWREENGAFASDGDILSVAGIGEAKLEAIKPFITY